MFLTKLISLANKLYDLGYTNDLNLVHKLIKLKINLTFPLSYKKAGKLNPTIHIIRHGNTLYNGNDGKNVEKLRGWLDINLSERGFEDAEKIAQFIQHFPISKIISSDLNRAYDTAKAIQRYTNVGLEKNSNLRPWNMGACMGKEVSVYVPVMLDYIKNKPDEKMPESTESFNMFKVRVLTLLQQLQNEAIKNPDKGHIIVVAHSRNARLTEAWVLAGCKDVKTIDLGPMLKTEDNIKPGHILTMQYIDGKWQLVDLPHQDLLDK